MLLPYPYLSRIPYFLFLINWSNLKRTFIGTDHHILPSPSTYIAGAIGPPVRTSDGPRSLTCALGPILSLLNGAAPAISSSYSSISLNRLVPINVQPYCKTKQGCSWSHIILWLWPDFSARSDPETPWKRCLSSQDPFQHLPFSSEYTPTRSPSLPLCRNCSDQGHQWSSWWLQQLPAQLGMCHLLSLWDLSLNCIFVKDYHKGKERDFPQVLPKFDNAECLAPILYNVILWDNGTRSTENVDFSRSTHATGCIGNYPVIGWLGEEAFCSFPLASPPFEPQWELLALKDVSNCLSVCFPSAWGEGPRFRMSHILLQRKTHSVRMES